MRRLFISDCEGPISKNDNAFETTAHYVPSGDKLFTVISRYDDLLADVLKRSGYKAGSTLKLVLPFLKAYDVTDQKMHEFSAKNLILISDVKNMLQHVRNIAPAFIISTSYEHYIRALCHALDFPFENTCCTRVSIDKYNMTEKEKTELKQIAREIAQMPMFEIPPRAKSMKSLSEEVRRDVRRLDEVFWERIIDMESGKIYREVSPVGGSEKAEAIKATVRQANATLADVMYVGDSITDEEAFKLVKGNGGLTLSFNGNGYAVRSAEIAVMSETSIVTEIIVEMFIKFGKEETLSIVENWSREALEKSSVTRTLLSRLFKKYPSKLPKAKIITHGNMEALAKESSEFRGIVRGENIGRLG